MDEVTELLRSRVPEQGPATIVHGDYRLDNCMLGPDGTVAAVLDSVPEMRLSGEELALLLEVDRLLGRAERSLRWVTRDSEPVALNPARVDWSIGNTDVPKNSTSSSIGRVTPLIVMSPASVNDSPSPVIWMSPGTMTSERTLKPPCGAKPGPEPVSLTPIRFDRRSRRNAVAANLSRSASSKRCV